MNSTKARILEVSIEQFNEKGFHQVTLADIAKSCLMSRGNLAYHYKAKINLLNDLVVRMVNEVREIQSNRKDYPAFSNLQLDVNSCRILQGRYKFMFRDSSVLEHKHIKKVLSIWSEVSIKRNKEAFAFGVSIGNLKPELFPGLYSQLAVNAWMVTFYWVAQESVRKVGALEEAEKMVWSTIIPHFTEKGLAVFKEFYGDQFLKEMGAPIEKELQEPRLF